MSNNRKSGWGSFSLSQKIFYIISLLLVLSMVLGLVSVAFTPAI